MAAQSNRAELEPRLERLVRAAQHWLPAGWRVEVVEALGPAAVELRLINPKGHRLAGRVAEARGVVFETYRRFADVLYRLQHRLYPELDDRLAWGGAFTTAHTTQICVGHFDLYGFRGHGRYQRPWDRDSKAPQMAQDARSEARP